MLEAHPDVAQLSVLLYLTGGLQNPFSLLFLAPGALFYAMTRRDGWPPVVAVAAFALGAPPSPAITTSDVSPSSAGAASPSPSTPSRS